MAISNKDLQSFIMGEGNLQKAKEMDLGSFLSSKDALGLANATDEEATAVKNLIDKTVDNQGIVPDAELDAAVGGKLDGKTVGIIVGASVSALAIGAGLGTGVVYWYDKTHPGHHLSDDQKDDMKLGKFVKDSSKKGGAGFTIRKNK